MADILDVMDELESDDFSDDVVSGDVVSGEIVEFDAADYEMDSTQAQQITEAIRSAATATYILLSEAHRHKAHKALGYETWGDYIREEFDMSPQRSYQLLDLGRAVAMIEAATPDGTEVKLTEKQARDIKRELPKITERIEEETRGMSAEEASQRAAEIVEESRKEARELEREEAKAKAKKEQELKDAEEEGYRSGLEAAADAMLAQADGGSYDVDRADGMTDAADSGLSGFSVDGEGDAALSPEDTMNVYNFFNVLAGISGLPEPDDFIKVIPASRTAEVENQLLEATSWLNRFQTLWELRNEG